MLEQARTSFDFARVLFKVFSVCRENRIDGLFLLSQRMRALLRGVFFLHLGFPEPQFKDLIIGEATKWK